MPPQPRFRLFRAETRKRSGTEIFSIFISFSFSLNCRICGKRCHVAGWVRRSPYANLYRDGFHESLTWVNLLQSRKRRRPKIETFASVFCVCFIKGRLIILIYFSIKSEIIEAVSLAQDDPLCVVSRLGGRQSLERNVPEINSTKILVVTRNAVAAKTLLDRD